MLETEHLEIKYSYQLTGEKLVSGEPCYLVELTAKVDNAAYDRQLLYMYKKHFIPCKIEMYAKGGGF